MPNKEWKIMEELIRQIKELSGDDKDRVYRMLWYDYVIEDIITRLAERSIVLDDEAIRDAASRYVYDVCYECNLSYWDNIDNLIDEQCRKSR